MNAERQVEIQTDVTLVDLADLLVHQPLNVEVIASRRLVDVSHRRAGTKPRVLVEQRVSDDVCLERFPTRMVTGKDRFGQLRQQSLL